MKKLASAISKVVPRKSPLMKIAEELNDDYGQTYDKKKPEALLAGKDKPSPGFGNVVKKTIVQPHAFQNYSTEKPLFIRNKGKSQKDKMRDRVPYIKVNDKNSDGIRR